MVIIKKRKSPSQLETERISEELRRLSEAIDLSDAGFNGTSDPDLVEAAIYERSSLLAKYSYLLRQLKSLSKEE